MVSRDVRTKIRFRNNLRIKRFQADCASVGVGRVQECDSRTQCYTVSINGRGLYYSPFCSTWWQKCIVISTCQHVIFLAQLKGCTLECAQVERHSELHACHTCSGDLCNNCEFREMIPTVWHIFTVCLNHSPMWHNLKGKLLFIAAPSVVGHNNQGESSHLILLFFLASLLSLILAYRTPSLINLTSLSFSD